MCHENCRGMHSLVHGGSVKIVQPSYRLGRSKCVLSLTNWLMYLGYELTMCCITFPFCHLYPASFVLICYTLSLKAHTLQGYHWAVTVHFFNNKFSCSLFILSFLFESFSSCYIFIVASILPLAPLIGL